MINKKQSTKKVIVLVVLVISVICILCILSITTLNYNKSSFTLKNLYNSFNSIKEPFDFFTCTINLKDIDQKYVDNYMQFDGKSGKCGPCDGATLKMNIETCHTDANGKPSYACNPSASITSSISNNINFPYPLSASYLNYFFCPK